MTTIIKRKIKGKPYYYAVECKRVNGQPRIVWQKYLGKAENLIRLATESPHLKPQESILRDFGAVAALWQITQEISLIETINRHINKRDQGVPVGEYITLAAINRALCPKSKSKIGQWYSETILTRLLPINKESLTPQHFWNHMSYINQEHIQAVETEITKRIIHDFGIDLKCIVYDTTNFFTYIANKCTSQIPQRGRNKAKRNDLRQVGLALLISRDFHIPLLHEVYAGNLHDTTQFASLTEELVNRYRIFSQNFQDITLIYDRGINSQDNQTEIDNSPYHYVASLVLTQYTKLLKIPLSKYQDFKDHRLSGVKRLRITSPVLGKDRTVVLTYNDELYIKQLDSFSRQINKRVKNVKELQKRLKSKKSKYSRRVSFSALEREIARLSAGPYVKQVLKITLNKEGHKISLNWRIDKKVLHQLSQSVFGKNFLVTDNDKWSDEDIVLTYRGRASIEQAFRQMKDPHFVSWSPMFHWTDQKIRVHAFYCVIALTLVSLLQRKLHHQGVQMSIPSILENLSKIKEVGIIYPSPKQEKQPLIDITLTQMNQTQRGLFNKLELGQYKVPVR